MKINGIDTSIDNTQPTVLVNGCFDTLHDGHRRLLVCAKGLGPVVVALNSDESVVRLKGRKPHRSYKERKSDIELFWYVNGYGSSRIEEFNTEEDLIKLIKKYSVEYIVKGVDTVKERQYQKVTGSELVRAVLFVDHGLMDIHSSNRERCHEHQRLDAGGFWSK
jgi:cytidyltransferase-like protein